MIIQQEVEVESALMVSNFNVTKLEYATVGNVADILEFLGKKGYDESVSAISNLIKNHTVYVAEDNDKSIVGLIGVYNSYNKSDILYFESESNSNTLMQKALLNALLFNYTSKEPLYITVCSDERASTLRDAISNRGFSLESTTLNNDGVYVYGSSVVV